jgi:hypothetical protein
MLGTFTADGHFRSDEHNPRGCILHIEEVGLARPPVVNALLKIRGEFGRLAHHIDLWEDGGRKITAGPDFWIVMSTNPPEDYGSREPVDQALARGVVFKRCAQIDKSSYLMMARRYFSFGLGNRPNVLPQSTILPYFRHPELCNEVAELMADFHAQAVEQCRGGESGRAQRIPVTLDDMARVAAFMLSCQSRDSTTGQFNVVHTLQRAVERMYLGRLLSESRDERGANVLIEAGARQATKSNIALSTKLQALFEQLLLGETGVKVFEQKKLCRAEILKILVSRAHESEERRKVQGVLSPAEELEFRRSRLQLEGDQQIDLTVQLLSRRGAAVAVGDSPQGSSH